MSFSHRLMEACQAKTVADVARKLQVPHPTARNYVQEGRLPSAEILIRIADETNVSLDWLLLGIGAKQKTKSNWSAVDLFDTADRKIVQDIADAGGISFEEAVVHLVREALAHKGFGQMPGWIPVPVFNMIDEDIDARIFSHLEKLPEPTRQAETQRLIGALVTKAAATAP